MSSNIVQHAWREPVYGAIQDWLRNWYRRIALALIYAAGFTILKGLRQNDVSGAFMHTFPIASGIALLLVGMYAIIQRRIDLYDDRLVVVQGRGGDRYPYSDIQRVVIITKQPRPSLIICLNSGKRTELFLGPELSATTIVAFLSEHGITCVEQ
jgi:hypothetical protein